MNTNESPENYVTAAALAHEAGEELLARLDGIMLKPKVILDAGCHGGITSINLLKRYPESQIFAVDASHDMLCYAQQNNSHRMLHCVAANAEKLPFQNQTVDLIFANFLHPWIHESRILLQEWKRVIKPGGLLVFNTLALGTMEDHAELHPSLIPQLHDIHDIGNMLVEAGWSDPVLDINQYTLQYRHIETLLTELQTTRFLLSAPLNRAKMDTLSLNIKTEIIFAHAFMPSSSGFKADEAGQTKVPLSYLRQLLKQ